MVEKIERTIYLINTLKHVEANGNYNKYGNLHWKILKLNLLRTPYQTSSVIITSMPF